MGYMDAVLNLFSDFYKAIDLKRAGKTIDFSYPDFAAGHAEMQILEAAINSKNTGAWANVG
jgi:hypothetical protein